MRAVVPTHIVWQAAGRPEPCGADGTPIPRARAQGHCAKCNDPAGVYSVDDLISSNFLPTRNANRLRAFGGDHYCAACVFSARTLRLRCISWFASESGVQFYRTRRAHKEAPQPDSLSTLLDPPPPPFVAGIPLYGIGHGGEQHYQRTWWPGEPRPENPLIKLQSKHVALYARAASSRDRFPVQVDDAGEFLLDRDTWLFARDDATAAMELLVDAGLKPWPAKLSLRTLTIQGRVPAGVLRHWRTLTESLVPHVSTVWWSLFVELLQEIPNDSTRKDAPTL